VSRHALRLDLADEQAWLGETPLRLTPKAFALLRHLMTHHDRLVTKAKLFQALWPGVTVSDGVLTTVVREIRKALGEGSRGGYIQTVHRRGYRFIRALPDAAALEAAPPAASIVGRDDELRRLQQFLQVAQSGARQLVFVTGEAGLGKTALIDAFLDHAAAAPDISVARGQCIERYGAAEAYLPWLDALGRGTSGWSPRCAAPRRCGWRRCRRCSIPASAPRCSARWRARRPSACCASSARRWSLWRRIGHW
jgi:DNA-binding winged helix-turn-helix (wHTH) protein